MILTSLIGRESATAESRVLEVSLSPSDGSELFTFAHASLADVDAAVASARQGMEMPEWRDITPDHRGRLLWRVSTLIEEHADELALMDANDAGMPLAMSRGVNVPLAAQVFRYYAGFATKIEGRLSQVSIPNTMHYTTREPIGVCALITPWNVPLAIAAWKLAPALATGNTAILKPAEQAVWSTRRLVEICREAGIPGEVVQVLLGGPEIGQALVRHRGVDKVSFTGSTEVGCQIVADVAPTLKRVSLELGGKAPSIVTASADMDQAIMGNLRGALFNSGQACGAYTRTFVHRSRADEFAERIAEAAKQMRVGHAMNEDTELGPLITRGQVDRVLSYIEGAGPRVRISCTAVTSSPATDWNSATSLSPRFSRTSRTTCALLRRRSSGPSSRSCPSMTRTRRSPVRMRVITALPRLSGRRTSSSRTRWPNVFARARCS